MLDPLGVNQSHDVILMNTINNPLSKSFQDFKKQNIRLGEKSPQPNLYES